MIREANVLYDNGREVEVPSGVKSYLSRLMDIQWDKVEWDGMVEVPPLQTDDSLYSVLKRYISSERISLDPVERFKHSIGMSSLEIVRAKKGRIPPIVDAVVHPLDHEAEEMVTNFSENHVTLTIAGGRTSVTGGIKSKGKGMTVCISTSNMKDLVVNGKIVSAGAGLTGEELEGKLKENGLTCGFFPESFSHSTVGGWIATRASGQESNEYGDIENLLLGVRLARKGGVLKDFAAPRYSAGLMAKDVALGSEGQNGLILSAYLEARAAPRKKYYYTHIFKSFYDAIDYASSIDRFPTVMRIMDETETYIQLLSLEEKKRKMLNRYLFLRGVSNGSLMVTINNEIPLPRFIKKGIWLGSSGAKMWEEKRFERPYMSNTLWKRGVVVDTLETSVSWDEVKDLHRSAIDTFHRTLKDLESNGLIMAHLSHQYPGGTCIYFSFMFRSRDEETTLVTIRNELMEVILSKGGTITHHHGIGSYFTKYVNPLVLNVQRYLRDRRFKQV